MSQGTNTRSVNPAVRACAGDMLTAAAACERALAHLGQAGTDNAELRTALEACAACCRQTGEVHQDGTDVDAAALAACAVSCTRCAELCSGMVDDAYRACAEACLRAASSCRQVGEPPEQRPSQDKVSADSFPASDPPATMAQASR